MLRDSAMLLDIEGDGKGENISAHCRIGLRRLDLWNPVLTGTKEYLMQKASNQIKQKIATTNEGGLLISPTFFGIDYYLRANALSSTNLHDFLNPEVVIDPVLGVEILDGSLYM